MANHVEDLKEALKRAFCSFIDEGLEDLVQKKKRDLIRRTCQLQYQRRRILKQPIPSSFDAKELENMIGRSLSGEDGNPEEYKISLLTGDPRPVMDSVQETACRIFMDIVADTCPEEEE